MVGVKTGRMENRKRKIRWKYNFLLFGSGEKTREIENEMENNPSTPTFFCPPNLGGKLRRKDVE